jgi:hypothetical protein
LYDCVRKKESVKETSPLASTHTLSTDRRAELRAAYTPRAGGAPAETAPEVAAAATCFQAADAAAVLRMRPKTNTKSAVKTLLHKTSPGSTRCKIVPLHRRHSHIRGG